MATLGTAYVQIAPSAQGISGSISNLLDPEATAAGKSVGAKIGGFAKKALVAAGVGAAFVKIVKDSMAEGGRLQQSYFGGLDTLYGEAADSARAYAKEAAKAGISMNSYSEQAVSFGAALKKAYGGDAKKAVEAANTAILDMADNSAKMGTDIQSIQNAYQGFAKQNYTMLDNLKLGYGGTKTEMLRLLDDANKINAQSGKMTDYQIDNLGDVYEAIHVIQSDLGLTGTAAYEAGQTFTGSFASMKAAAQNFLGELALGMDVTDSLQVLVVSATNFFFNNFIPMLGNIVRAIPSAVGTFIKEGAPLLIAQLNTMLTSLATWVKGIADNLSSSKVKQWTVTTLPKIIQAGTQLIKQLASTFIKNLPAIVSAIGRIGAEIVKGLGSAIWGKVSAAAAGVRDKFMSPINELVGKVQGIIDKIKGKFPIKLGHILSFKIPKIDVGTKTVTVGEKDVKVPTFSISWHARGGIFDQPTLLQSANGNFHGVGERGPEAIIPLNALWDRLDEQAARTERMLAQQTQILMGIYEESQKEKNFRVDGMWAGRYVNSLVKG